MGGGGLTIPSEGVLVISVLFSFVFVLLLQTLWPTDTYVTLMRQKLLGIAARALKMNAHRLEWTVLTIEMFPKKPADSWLNMMEQLSVS